MDKRKKLVHEDHCEHLKGFQSKIYLGNFSDVAEAVEEGRRYILRQKCVPDA